MSTLQIESLSSSWQQPIKYILKSDWCFKEDIRQMLFKYEMQDKNNLTIDNPIFRVSYKKVCYLPYLQKIVINNRINKKQLPSWNEYPLELCIYIQPMYSTIWWFCLWNQKRFDDCQLKRQRSKHPIKQENTKLKIYLNGQFELSNIDFILNFFWFVNIPSILKEKYSNPY